MLQRRVLFASLLVCALLGACGYHLKGASKLNAAYANLYLDTPDTYSEVHRALSEALMIAGASFRARRGDQGAVLEITHDEAGRRIRTVSARNVPTEYEIFYHVTYRVVLDNHEVLPLTDLSLSRIINFDETAELEKEREEMLLREAMARDLAERIVRQLAAL